MKLRHIQERTIGSNQKLGTLETTPSSNLPTGESPHRSCELDLLEVTQKSQSKGSQVVRNPTRLQPRNPTHTREVACSPRHVIKMTGRE